ncbi:MAG: carboxypeptidase-like regulatory domain-containing protein, partial [Candidatus Neomarinimicrobiota bacterium]
MIQRRIITAAFLMACMVMGQERETVHLRGTVLSDENNPLAYVNIIVPGTDLGTVSGRDGSFHLELPAADSLTLSFRYIGYETKTITLLKRDWPDTPLIVVLKVGLLRFSPIEVIGESALARAQLVEPGLRIFRGEEMAAIPSLGGADVFRALQALP